jgi:Flp pilus assembly protein TadD
MVGHQRNLSARALSRARALLDLGRVQAAAKEVRRALALDPHHAEALELYGLCMIRAGDLEEARRALTAAIAAAPTEPHSHYLLGYAERESSRPAAAEAAYREALRLAADEPVYLRALAELLATEKRFAEAMTLAKKAVELAPDRASNHITLGYVASSSGDRAMARRCYEKALSLDPTDAVAWNNLGCVDLAQGRPLQARARFREALRLNPEGRMARENLRMVQPPQRPPEVYRDVMAFEQQLVKELIDGVLLRPGRPRTTPAEIHLLSLLSATEGRAAGLVLRRAPRALVLSGIFSAGALRLLRAGPLGVAAVVGSASATYLLSRAPLRRWQARYRELLAGGRSEYDRLQREWLEGALHRRDRDAGIDRLIDRLCHEIEEEGAPARRS